ncbi:hypothetical protein HDU85_005376 [Gaertneriomyces sp. JEL0708]|nr:hypothetical protein HDU85_005376 [Gaertneriomyces sp. JEL0708]
MEELPIELKAHIVPYLTFPTLLSLHNVSRTWRCLVMQRIDSLLHSVHATLFVERKSGAIVPVQMVLARQGAGETTTRRVASFVFESASARILGPNHYLVENRDASYRLCRVSISFTGQNVDTFYKTSLPLDTTISLKYSKAVVRSGVKNVWQALYEVNSFKRTKADAEYRPWLLTSKTREDVVKQDMVHKFFIPRNVQVSWEMLWRLDQLRERGETKWGEPMEVRLKGRPIDASDVL